MGIASVVQLEAVSGQHCEALMWYQPDWSIVAEILFRRRWFVKLDLDSKAKSRINEAPVSSEFYSPGKGGNVIVGARSFAPRATNFRCAHDLRVDTLFGETLCETVGVSDPVAL